MKKMRLCFFELMLLFGIISVLHAFYLIYKPLAVLFGGLLLVVLSLKQIALLKRQNTDA